MITQQILDALSANWEKLTELTMAVASRATWILTGNLVTGPYSIEGGEDTNGEPYPIKLIGGLTESSGPFYAPTVNASALKCTIITADTLLTEQEHAGKTLIVDTPETLSPDANLPAPDASNYWFCQIINTSTGNVPVTCPELQTLNGLTDTVDILPGRAALLIKTTPTALRLVGGV